MMDEKYAGTTPETDAFLEDAFSMIYEAETLEDFARRLERERNGLAAEVLRLIDDLFREKIQRATEKMT